MIAFLEKSIGRWILKKGVDKDRRTPVALNISDMKSALLVFDITNQNDFFYIQEFQKKLKLEGFEKVELIGFSLEKELPSFVDSKLVQVLGKKDVSLLGIPSDEFVQSLFQKKMDLLVDCTSENSLPTDYLMALANAKTKVGAPSQINEYIFDLLIDGNRKENFGVYVKNVIHFLKMINRK